jgi:hypothetical protein
MAMTVAFVIAVVSFPSIFPIELFVLSSLFSFMGGGTTVITALVHSMVADTTTDL